MDSSMIAVDLTAQHTVQEFGVIVVAVAYLVLLGGLILGATVLCGWHVVKSVVMDWLHGKATITCR